jgi:hypothetical protein
VDDLNNLLVNSRYLENPWFWSEYCMQLGVGIDGSKAFARFDCLAGGIG